MKPRGPQPCGLGRLALRPDGMEFSSMPGLARGHAPLAATDWRPRPCGQGGEGRALRPSPGPFGPCWRTGVRRIVWRKLSYMEATLVDILHIASETDPSLHVSAGVGPCGPLLSFVGQDCQGRIVTFVVSLRHDEQPAS